VGSSSALALTGQNPGFMQPTIGASNFVTSGQATPGSFTPLNALIGNFPVTEKTEIYSLRLDHKLTNSQQLMVRASVSPSYITGIEESAANQNLGENAYSRTATQDFHDVTIAGQYTTLLGQNKVNELRIQFSRHPIEFANTNSPGGNGVAVNIPGFAYFGKTPFSVVDRVEDQSQLQDNFTYTREAHTAKVGIDLRYIPIDLKQGQLYGGGDYTFAALNATDVSSALRGFRGSRRSRRMGWGFRSRLRRALGRPR
jgi:hypothetical protein